MNQKSKKWWGTFELSESQMGHWQIGPLSLWIKHLKNEWRSAYSVQDDPLASDLKINVPCPEENLNQNKNLARFGFSKNIDHLELTPILADRPVVTRPETPFSILPGEKITVYVSTPLWIEIKAGNKKLQEVPIFRPSDTWFGPSTIEGELCYASKTNCNLRLEELPFRLHRATTAVHIDNKQDEALVLESLNLPVKYLSLYESEGDQLWTESVTLKQSRDTKLSQLQIEKRLPKSIKIVKKLTEAREKNSNNILVRAFSTLFD